MTACEPPPVQQTVLEKITSFMSDPAYLEILESSASYNSRLTHERRLRMPFVDTHTGVAQTHCDLWKNSRQRMPGLTHGQVYTYPSKRWCKRRRQYLTSGTGGRRPDRDEGDSNTGDNPLLNEDSKDSSGLKDEVAKEQWYFEDEMMELDAYDEPDMDSDYDYDEHYRSGRRRKRTGKAVPRSGRNSRPTASPKGEPETPASGGRGGRGRKRALLYDMDNDKPFACELCSARYKTRPGLTYHYTHTHKETKECDVSTPDSSANQPPPQREEAPPMPPAVAAPMPMTHAQEGGGPAGSGPLQGSYLPFPKVPGGNHRRSRPSPAPVAPPPKESKEPEKPSPSPATSNLPDTPEMDPYKRLALSDDKARVAASPYCDFCLGDSAENRKTSNPEELVSCSDCGRSGHPSCLQFTPNMIVSVRKYRWQCIECKCCSICGTSDNDDQLLFCDDCDRGYHMYCLAPPLTTPPEGSWSCGLCLVAFHRGGK